MSGMVMIQSGSESELHAAVAYVGPVAVAVDARSNGFRVCWSSNPTPSCFIMTIYGKADSGISHAKNIRGNCMSKLSSHGLKP